jgi:4-oxalocrotonate tautomerase
VPFITVEMLKGRTIDQRRRFVEQVTELAVKELNARPSRVRIRFLEMAPEDMAISGKLASDE